MVKLGSMPVEQTLIDRSHPKVRLRSRERGNAQTAERSVQRRKRTSIPYEDSGFPGTNKDASTPERKNRSQRTSILGIRAYLFEAAAIKGKKPGALGRDPELRTDSRRSHASRHANQGGRRQFFANVVFGKRFPIRIKSK